MVIYQLIKVLTYCIPLPFCHTTNIHKCCIDRPLSRFSKERDLSGAEILVLNHNENQTNITWETTCHHIETPLFEQWMKERAIKL